MESPEDAVYVAAYVVAASDRGVEDLIQTLLDADQRSQAPITEAIYRLRRQENDRTAARAAVLLERVLATRLFER